MVHAACVEHDVKDIFPYNYLFISYLIIFRPQLPHHSWFPIAHHSWFPIILFVCLYSTAKIPWFVGEEGVELAKILQFQRSLLDAFYDPLLFAPWVRNSSDSFWFGNGGWGSRVNFFWKKGIFKNFLLTGLGIHGKKDGVVFRISLFSSSSSGLKNSPNSKKRFEIFRIFKGTIKIILFSCSYFLFLVT